MSEVVDRLPAGNGTSGNDTLQGTPGDDVICGGPGDDVISAGGGNDIVYGERGHDVMYGEGGNDRLYGGTGDDIVLGGDGDDQLLAGAERRDLNAGEPSEVLQLDETPPTVTISNPADQVIVAVGVAVPLTYTCTDDTAIRSCSGTVPSGQLMDTSKPGTRTVQVTATDTAGNFATASLVYNVIANVDAVRTTGGNLTINGAGNKILGPVTSNGDVRLTGAGNTTYASVLYTGSLSNVGASNQFQVPPVKAGTADLRPTTTVDQWRPGTPNANALSSDFKDMTANCGSGVWAPTAPLLSGVYYSPCDVRISSGPTGPVTIISEKRISITTAGATWKPKAPAISLLSGSTDPTVISVAGAGSTFTGEILAPNGTITISGANLKLQCGVTAKAILLNGAGNQYSNTCV